MKAVNVVLVGFGRVGKAFLQVISEKKELLRKRYNLDIMIKAIFRRGRACILQDNIDVNQLLEKDYYWKPGIALAQVLDTEEPGVLVECTPSNIKTGEPGLTHINLALDKGWHVATANKGPLVVDLQSLREKAKKNRLALKFSGATAAALPALDVALYSLAGTEITRIEGILNGTTNYILTKMEEGMDYRDALKEAQAKGIAESDPSLDVGGWDTAVKILLISNAVLETDFTLEDMNVEGIENISSRFIKEKREEEKSLKLLGRLTKEENDYKIEVALTSIDDSHPLFGIKGAEKGISFTTDTMDKVTVTGGESDPKGAGASILKDIINIYSG
ncbi:MAG: homoserine dehydrogenase [Candidatus Aminicenantaceae bacterium]